MSWNPNTYNKFKSERFAPFYDLSALIQVKAGMSVIDLGCGTGELTRLLSDTLPGSSVLGIDSSKEMLQDSKAFVNEQVTFQRASIEEQINSDKKWDLVFSNAALQWVNNHEALLPKIISTLNTAGQISIQMPSQNHNITNIILNEVADEEPFKTAMQGWNSISPVLSLDAYAQILFENGSKTMTVFEKIYPLVVADSNALFDWVSGTALIPYLERLQDENRQLFVEAYKKRLQNEFQKSPVFYPFKRILIAATF